MLGDSEVMVWVVAAIFYIPIHVGVPALVIFLVLDVTEKKRACLLKKVFYESCISVVIAFPVAAFFWQDKLWVSILFLMGAMCFPFISIIKNKTPIN